MPATRLDLDPLRALAARPRRLLAVFAHPDDESYGCAGTLARAAIDPHAGVVLLTLTSGEASTVLAAQGMSREAVRREREARMERVAERLGLDRLLLPRLPDGRLASRPLGEVGGLVRSVVDAFRPDVVVAQDARGVNGHPDHIAAHWAVRYALEGGDDGRADAPAPRLATIVYTREVAEMAKPRLIFATPEEEIDVVVRLSAAEIDAKEDCLCIHDAIVTLKDAPDATRLRRPAVEHYDLPHEPHDPPLDDLY